MRIPKALLEPALRQSLLIATGVWVATVPVFMAPSLAAPKPAPVWVWIATALVSLVGVLLTPVLLWVVRATDGRARRAPRLLLIVVSVAAVGLIHSVVDAAVHRLFEATFAPDSPGTMFVDKDGGLTPAPMEFYVLANFITLVWVHAGVTALGALSRFNMRVRRQEVATAEARAAANQAKLETLRLQLSPHFMFNTLNAISSLILIGRNADAERMLTRLSDFLRASLGPGETEPVSLASELSAVSAYLDIESLRYDGQLGAEVMSDESLHEVMVPTFLLQPLAEQAVAHAVSPPRRGVVIRVEASREGPDTLVVIVEARAREGGESSAPPSLELAAVRSRLAAVYGDRAEIEGMSDGAEFRAVARLPLDGEGAAPR